MTILVFLFETKLAMTFASVHHTVHFKSTLIRSMCKIHASELPSVLLLFFFPSVLRVYLSMVYILYITCWLSLLIFRIHCNVFVSPITRTTPITTKKSEMFRNFYACTLFYRCYIYTAVCLKCYTHSGISVCINFDFLRAFNTKLVKEFISHWKIPDRQNIALSIAHNIGPLGCFKAFQKLSFSRLFFRLKKKKRKTQK